MRGKMLFAFTLVCVVIFVGMQIFGLQPSLKALEDQGYSTLSQTADLMAESCQEILSSTEKTSYALLWFDELYSVLTQSNQRKYQSSYLNEMSQLRLCVVNMIPDNRQLSFRLYDLDENIVVEAINNLAEIDQEQESEWIQMAINAGGRCIWRTEHQVKRLSDFRNTVKVLSMYRVVVDINTFKPIGIMRISILEDELTAVVNASKQEGINRYLVDPHDGDLYIFNQDEETDGLEAKFSSIGSTFEQLSNDTETAKQQGVIISSLENTDLAIVFIYDNQFFLRTLPFMQTMWTIIAVLMVIALLISSVASVSLSKPIRDLAKTMKLVSSGDLNAHAVIQTKDEIGWLAGNFNRMLDAMRKMMDDLKETTANYYEMRLQALQLQMNPHFLFNTLDNIRWMALKHKDEETADYLLAFSNLVRKDFDFRTFTTIEVEMETVNDFIVLEKLRFADMLNFCAMIPAELKSLMIPRHTIQPLVENAITHGFLDRSKSLTIFLVIEVKGDTIVIDVSDNGTGCSESQMISDIIDGKKKAPHLMALRNIADRIRTYWGKDAPYGVNFNSDPDMGTRVVITLPVESEIYHRDMNE